MSDTQLVHLIGALRNDIAGIEDVFRKRCQDTLNRNSPFLHRTKTELALARGWLGKLLGAMGEPNPYPESTNPQSPVIEPPSYTPTVYENMPERVGSIEQQAIEILKWLRKQTEAMIEAMEQISRTSPSGPGGNWRFDYEYHVGHHLGCAKMMLGEELGTYRNGRRAV